MRFFKIKYSLLVALVCSNFISYTYAKDNAILVQSTTSTANSGLYDYLLPHFQERTGIKVNVVAVGTGQAIRNASNCDADVLLVHAKEAEQKFVADGYGVKRHDLMYNDFVIVGPVDDPASIKTASTVTDVLEKIAESRNLFVSRGDNSGTHIKELSLWQSGSIDPTESSGLWYRETGSGMGATLNIAIGMGAYTMTDRATWINFKNRADHTVLFEGDTRMFNQYGVILVNPGNCPDVKTNQGSAFVDWIISTEGQGLIAEYQVAGQQLFFPNAE